jgi:dTDP-glucose pyrophosphorylase
LCRELRPSPRNELELPDLVSLLIATGHDVRAVEIEAPLHVGTPDQLRSAEQQLGLPQSRSAAARQVP